MLDLVPTSTLYSRVKSVMKRRSRNSFGWTRACRESGCKRAKTVAHLENAPTRYGRVSFLVQAINSTNIRANVTLPCTFWWPVGCSSYLPVFLEVRFRTIAEPANTSCALCKMWLKRMRGKKLLSVRVGGKPWSKFNATKETILFLSQPTTSKLGPFELQSIEATLGLCVSGHAFWLDTGVEASTLLF